MDVEIHEGGCQCGAVRYRTSGAPKRVIACHCAACKQRTGAAYGIGVYFDESQVELDGGDLRSYEFHSTESGRWLRNEFCARCGTALSWTLEMRPGMRAIAGGTFDDPSWFQVQAHIWTRSARPDMRYPQDMPVHPEALPT